MPKFSFIIPVYKTEQYLEECVESILAQTCQDFEILLIDDGSPDRAGKICEKLAANDDKIRTMHIENSGASVARNTGFEAAKGEYVIFLDSDDYWRLCDGLERAALLLAPDVDILVFASCDYLEKNGEIREDRYQYPEEMNAMEPEECLEFMVTHDLLNMHAGKKIFRKDFLGSHDLLFKPGIRTEDVELGFRVVNCLPRFRFLNEKLYVYRHHPGSVTASIDAKHLYELANIVAEYAEFSYVNTRVQELMLSYDAYQLSLLLAHLYLIPRKDQKHIMQRMQNYCYLFEYKAYPRTRKIARLYSALGFGLTQKILSWYLRLKK